MIVDDEYTKYHNGNVDEIEFLPVCTSQITLRLLSISPQNNRSFEAIHKSLFVVSFDH